MTALPHWEGGRLGGGGELPNSPTPSIEDNDGKHDGAALKYRVQCVLRKMCHLLDRLFRHICARVVALKSFL